MSDKSVMAISVSRTDIAISTESSVGSCEMGQEL